MSASSSSPGQGTSSTRQNRGGSSGRRKLTVDSGLATIIAAFILAAGGVVGVVIGRASASTSTSTVVSSGHSPQSTANTDLLGSIGISLSYHQLVPWCSTLRGTGKIPPGDTLLIFDREVGADDFAPEDSKYSLDGPAVASGSGWKLFPIYIGPRTVVSNFYDEVTAVLVPDEIATFIEDISLPWASHLLPPALESRNAFLLRDQNLKQCY
jgi:hypothetical protein